MIVWTDKSSASILNESFLKPQWDLYKTLPKQTDFQEQDLLDLTEPTQNSSNLKIAVIKK